MTESIDLEEADKRRVTTGAIISSKKSISVTTKDECTFEI